MPANTVKIDRSTRWGNPYVAGAIVRDPRTGRRIRVATRAIAISLFERYLRSAHATALLADARAHLRGVNLACWCPLDEPCHGDVLLRLVNSPKKRAR